MTLRTALGRNLTMLFFFGIVAASLSAQEKEWSLVGSWTNPEYDKMGGAWGKVVYGSDNIISLYQLTTDTTRLDSGPYIIERDWTESGAHWFKVKLSFADGTYYEIDKLTNGGKTYESVFTTGQYPTTFDKSGETCSYTVRHRQ